MGTRLISIRETCGKINLSRTTIWKKSKQRTFPQPVDLGGGRKAFVESEIDQWIEDRVAERNAAD